MFRRPTCVLDIYTLMLVRVKLYTSIPVWLVVYNLDSKWIYIDHIYKTGQTRLYLDQSVMVGGEN